MTEQPSITILDGQFITLKPMNLVEDIPELFKNSSGDQDFIWQYMLGGPFDSEDKMMEHYKDRCSTNHVFTVFDKKSGERIGSCCYMNVVPEMKRLEIGGIWYTPRFHRTYANTETCYLLIKYAIEDLKYRRIEWKCNNDNEASKKAALRLGFKYEGLFRQHMIIKGKNRDTAYFSIIDSEWEEVKGKLESILYERQA